MRNDGNHLPKWITKGINDEVLKEDVASIYEQTRKVLFRNSAYVKTRSDGDKADLEAEKQNLRDIMLEIYLKGNTPLWQVIMQIRPRVLGKRLDLSHAQILCSELWNIKKETEEDGDKEQADFFKRLARQLDGEQMSACSAIISGGVYKNRKTEEMYNFPGIPGNPRTEPGNIRKRAGVKLTINPNNIQPIKKAYQMMIEQAKGGSAKAMAEATLKAADEVLRQVYSYYYSQKENNH